jgi:hypothetical protein
MERKHVVTFEERESLDRSGMPDEQFFRVGLRIGYDAALEGTPPARQLHVAATNQAGIAAGTAPRERHPIRSKSPPAPDHEEFSLWRGRDFSRTSFPGLVSASDQNRIGEGCVVRSGEMAPYVNEPVSSRRHLQFQLFVRKLAEELAGAIHIGPPTSQC